MFLSNRWLFILGILLTFSLGASSQCTNPIRNYPYLENFESSDGGFRSSDQNFWKWGTPAPNSRSIITRAASGQKCWTVGGFSGKLYPGGIATLTSPCFDLGTLTLPEISFKLIWETETNFDGVLFQYSLNEGTTWLVLGDAQSNNNCRGINWYNTNSIRYLDNRTSGWSGSVNVGSGAGCTSGGGSRTWVDTKHKLSGLGGSRKVIFRFVFGSGTSCNDYEGFGIDDFSISEGVPSAAAGSFTCQVDRRVQFSNVLLFCQRSVSWNFGDINSGSSNTSTLEDPVHQFSAPGTYNVTQTVTLIDNTSTIKSHTVTILEAGIQQTAQIRCHGNRNAALNATVNSGSGPYEFSWNNNSNINGQTLSNLGPGFYFVTVNAVNACPDSASILIAEPNPIQLDSSINNETCSQANGSIGLQIQGGTTPYQFTWSNGAISSSISGLQADTYSVAIKDANDCIYNSGPLVVQNIDVPARPNLGNDTLICNNETLILNPGTFSSFRWQDNSTRSTFTVQNTGRYYVDVRNAEGCIGSDTIDVTVDCKGVFIPNAFSPNGDGLNETFGPIGDLALMRNYSLFIYNRFGQAVFQSIDPTKRWDGKFKGKQTESGAYTWQMKYRLNGGKETIRKGTLILLH